jgi:hypothetical protein
MSVIWSWTYFYNLHWNNYLYFKGLLYNWEEIIMMALLHMAGLENSECIWKIQRGSDCIRFSDWKIENATFAEYSCPIRLRGARYLYLNVAVEKRNIYHSVTQIPASQALVSFKKYMPPPLPYFKVSICPLPLPHFASICFPYLWSFRWPNYIDTLPRYFSFRLPNKPYLTPCFTQKKKTLGSDVYLGSYITSTFCLPNDRPDDKIYLIS